MYQEKVSGDEFSYDVVDQPKQVGRRQRTIHDYIHWLLRRAWVIALTTTVGVVLGFYVFERTPETYKSVATISVNRQDVVVEVDDNDALMELRGQQVLNTVAQKLMLPKSKSKRWW